MHTIDLSRRGFVGGLLATVTSMIVKRRAAGTTGPAPPTETGLSSEGLLVGRPGFQPRTVMPLPHPELPGFLSRAQLEAHHAEYVRNFERLQDAELRLQDPSTDISRYSELRRAQVAAANSMLLHEFYFGNL